MNNIAWRCLLMASVVVLHSLQALGAGPAEQAAWASQADPVCALGEAEDPRLQAGLEALLSSHGLESAVKKRQLALSLLILTDPARPRLAQVNGKHMMYAASLPKIVALLGAAVAIDEGRLALDAALEENLHKMVRYSCNACTNRVIEQLGHQPLTALVQSPRYRFYDQQQGGGLWLGKEYGPQPAWQRDPLYGLSHGATTFQVVRFYCGLQRGTLVSEAQNKLILEALSRPGIEHKFVKGLAQVEGLQVFRKSGTWRSYHADSALVRTPNGEVYAVVGLTDSPQGGEWLATLAEPLHHLALAQVAAGTAPGLKQAGQ